MFRTTLSGKPDPSIGYWAPREHGKPSLLKLWGHAAAGEAVTAAVHWWEGDPGRGPQCPPLPPRGTSTVWGPRAATPPGCPSSALFPHLSREFVHRAVWALGPFPISPSTAGAGPHHVPGPFSPPDLPSPSALITG